MTKLLEFNETLFFIVFNLWTQASVAGTPKSQGSPRVVRPGRFVNTKHQDVDALILLGKMGGEGWHGALRKPVHRSLDSVRHV